MRRPALLVDTVLEPKSAVPAPEPPSVVCTMAGVTVLLRPYRYICPPAFIICAEVAPDWKAVLLVDTSTAPEG